MGYKVYYFNAKGRVEGIRMLLTHLGVDFEDVRIEMPDWPAQKMNFPYGQVPCLEKDGKKLGQTSTIYRYLANAHDLMPKNALTAAKVDEILTSTDDCFGAIMGLMALKNDKEKLKAAYEEKMNAVILPRFKEYDEYLGKHGGTMDKDGVEKFKNMPEYVAKNKDVIFSPMMSGSIKLAFA